MIYRIRPKDDKHPVLLPEGTGAQLHLEKDKMKLRVEDLDDRERDYTARERIRERLGSPELYHR